MSYTFPRSTELFSRAQKSIAGGINSGIRKMEVPVPLYFDHGSETLDAAYKRYQDRVDALVGRRGYVERKNWLTRSFPGQKHNEISWASRLDIPLQFLLPPK